MDQKSILQSLGQRIVSAARLAVELHLAADDFEKSERRQRDLIGGTDPSIRCTCDGCGHTGSSDADLVTDDTLHFGSR